MVGAAGAAACPFCGSEEVYVEEYEHHPGAVRWRVLCAGCMAGIDTGTRQSAGAAVQDWNRRAERTCRNDSKVGSNSPGWLFDFKCSECGDELCAEEMGNSPLWVDGDAEPISYCPNCGAKVVDDD